MDNSEGSKATEAPMSWHRPVDRAAAIGPGPATGRAQAREPGEIGALALSPRHRRDDGGPVNSWWRRVPGRRDSRSGASVCETRRRDHVERLALEHPPIELSSVDYTVKRPREVAQRFGIVLSYMARVELEAERNVLELRALLPQPPEIDRHFYDDVWQPQETRHGQILDELHSRLGLPPIDPNLSVIDPKLKLLGMVGHLDAIQDVSRMLYYLTGMATERSAVLAYNVLLRGVLELGEIAIAETVVAPIRRQEPGHFAFYQMSAQALRNSLHDWQKWLTRRMRTRTFAPVGVNNSRQQAEFGAVLGRLGIDKDIDGFAARAVRTERELLWASASGLSVPAYVLRAFHDAARRAPTSSALGIDTLRPHRLIDPWTPDTKAS
jgi:hypothetical protein